LKEIANELLNPLYDVLAVIVEKCTEKQPMKLLAKLTEKVYDDFLNLVKDKSFFGLLKGIIRVACNYFKADDVKLLLIDREKNVAYIHTPEVKVHQLPGDLLVKKTVSVSKNKSIAGDTWDSVKYIYSPNGLYALELCYKNCSIEFDLRPECAYALFKLIENFSTKLTLLSQRVTAIVKNNERKRIKQGLMSWYKYINAEDKSLMNNLELVGQKVSSHSNNIG